MCVAGTFAFATFVNWTINGRSILPLTIVAGILISRRLERRTGSRNTGPALVWPLVGSAVLSLLVAYADVAFANTARTAAERIYASYGVGRKIWFQGHWGFQYYMQQMGAVPIDVKAFTPMVGDVVVVPGTNTNLYGMPKAWPVLRTLDIPSSNWLSTMSFELGAGFYADVFGPLPFVVAPVKPEQVKIFEVQPTN